MKGFNGRIGISEKNGLFIAHCGSADCEFEEEKDRAEFLASFRKTTVYKDAAAHHPAAAMVDESNIKVGQWGFFADTEGAEAWRYTKLEAVDSETDNGFPYHGVGVNGGAKIFVPLEAFVGGYLHENGAMAIPKAPLAAPKPIAPAYDPDKDPRLVKVDATMTEEAKKCLGLYVVYPDADSPYEVGELERVDGWKDAPYIMNSEAHGQTRESCFYISKECVSIIADDIDDDDDGKTQIQVPDNLKGVTYLSTLEDAKAAAYYLLGDRVEFYSKKFRRYMTGTLFSVDVSARAPMDPRAYYNVGITAPGTEEARSVAEEKVEWVKAAD